MLRNLRGRRRPRYSAQLCAVVAALLLLLSVSLLYSRLGSDRDSLDQYQGRSVGDIVSDPLLEDADPADAHPGKTTDDRIDELDDVQDESDQSRGTDEEEIIGGGESEEDDLDLSRVSGFYFDQVYGVIRRALDKKSIDQWEDYESFDANVGFEDHSKVAFGSDDLPVGEDVRKKMVEMKGIEDVLMLKIGSRVSPLREGWGPWFDAKSDFLRRDRMFRSNLEMLNPLSNPLLQDPDGVGVTGLTKGDKLVQKDWLRKLKKLPFLVNKPLGIEDSPDRSKSKSRLKEGGEDNVGIAKGKSTGIAGEGRSEVKRAERRTLNDNGSMLSYRGSIAVDSEILYRTRVADDNSSLRSNKNENVGESSSDSVQSVRLRSVEAKPELADEVYADGKRWGYFPGLHPKLSFSNFMDSFFRKGKCSMRIFMVWNSPPWAFSVRHQRSLESLLLHHREACVVVFSETIELNFFDGLAKDGFKVAVAMPNLDELFKDTPVHVFASVWFEWRKTTFYPTHNSELVRLAALYKYGGLYLDSDIIVLKPLSSLNNTVGLEDQTAGSSLNGAVMSFRKHSPFIMECLKEFYATYDDTSLRWNGADLLTRIARNFTGDERASDNRMELTLQPSFIFFPINRDDIARYFSAPSTETEKSREDDLFKNILDKSFTLHFWNSLTSALVPEPDSLVARIMNHFCIHCSDVL